jgi:hypothetical protein
LKHARRGRCLYLKTFCQCETYSSLRRGTTLTRLGIATSWRRSLHHIIGLGAVWLQVRRVQACGLLAWRVHQRFRGPSSHSESSGVNFLLDGDPVWLICVLAETSCITLPSVEQYHSVSIHTGCMPAYVVYSKGKSMTLRRTKSSLRRLGCFPPAAVRRLGLQPGLV